MLSTDCKFWDKKSSIPKANIAFSVMSHDICGNVSSEVT
jgi:hypothetical protein